MLKPFQIRDLHRCPSSSQDNGEPSSDILQDIPPSPHRPGIVAISASQYNDIASSHPHARLTYIDDDDGELITVGSSLELSQRLDEPVPASTDPYLNSQPSDLDPMHIFDIRRSTPVIELWKKHEYNPFKENVPATNHTSVASPTSEPSLPGVENDGERTQGDNGATAPNVRDEAEPLMAAFEAEMAKILSASETLNENTAHQEDIVPSTEDQNRTTADRLQIPTESFINAMQNLVHGAETLSSGVRSRLPEIERQFQNAQRALPGPVGSSMQVALTALEGQARNLVSAINNASTAGGQSPANLFPRELPTAANTVESLRSMASELGHMGHTLFEAFENELGCNTQGSQNQAPSAATASSVTDAAGPALADDNDTRTENAPNATDANPTTAPTVVNLENEKEPTSSDKAEVSPEPVPAQEPADAEPVSQPPHHNEGARSRQSVPPGAFSSHYNVWSSAHGPFGPPPHRPRGHHHIPGAFPPHPPPPPHFPPPGMGWPFVGPSHGHPRAPFAPPPPPPPFSGPPRPHRSLHQFPFNPRPYRAFSDLYSAAPSHAETSNRSSPGRSAQTALFIGNVGFNVNDKMIRDVFAAKGFLVDVYLPLDSVTQKHAGFGYLHFPSVHAAKAALHGLQGTLIDGHSINLEFSDPSPFTVLNAANEPQQPSVSRHAPSPSELQTSQRVVEPPSEQRPANNGKSLPLSVADMCSVNGNARNESAKPNDSDSSERLNALYPSLVPQSVSQRSDTNATKSPSDLIRPMEWESRFPPISQLDALFLTKQRREGDSTHSSLSRTEPTANQGPVVGRSVSPNIPGAFPEAQKSSLTAASSTSPQQTNNQNTSAEPHCSRRSKTVRTLNPSRRHSGPWESIAEGPCSDRSLRRRATERSSLRSGWSSHPHTGNARLSSVHPAQADVPHRFDARQRSIADCVSTLARLGYGSSEEGGLQRIGVYAAAADGRVSDAIDMIEEERKAYAQRLKAEELNHRRRPRDCAGILPRARDPIINISPPAPRKSSVLLFFYARDADMAKGFCYVLQKGHNGSSSLEDQEIKLNGFVRSVRKQKRFAFAQITDGSTVEPVQAFLKPAQAADLTTGTAVEISGVWKACPPGKEQSHELQTTTVNVVGEADPETYPIQKKYHTPEFLRQVPHLRLRTPFNSLLSRFRSECLYHLGNTFREAPNGGFVQVHPPLITSSDCEGAGETFTVVPRGEATTTTTQPDSEHFFRAPKYLTVSSQLHLEAYAAELGNVWTMSPMFRAEKSDTPRHLSEFYMLEAEMNFMPDLDSLTDSVEHILRDVTRRLYDSPVGQEILSAKRSGEPGQAQEQTQTDGTTTTSPALRQRWQDLMDGPKWARMTYTQVIEQLQDAVAKGTASFEYAPIWTDGLQLEHEKYIVDEICGGRPVFVTDYPKSVKPFYMAPSDITTTSTTTPNETVACFDLLLPEVSEVAGGSLREHRLPNLIQNMREHGLIKSEQPAAVASETAGTTDPAATDKPLYPYLQPGEDLSHLEWYADLRRWGTAPHGGFGMGFDRFLSYLAGVSSVRDVVAFPRYFGRADC
ncbi:asparaginyl-tRNA synthetase Slm5 [Aspergillus affinis]|uniref:asparaginyl-tRNA synthetase Slm5 n=1 Tax=Aspergillus affinis TaxID=1070780 RepID=UPI0022FF2BC7|nr:asparaginyl-tRNA synthetase Slm5 [Aspergillus affinis]KAI9043763.1 asparaginyl-tRNA synthetase Slm5 [Aspergillus affinis]